MSLDNPDVASQVAPGSAGAARSSLFGDESAGANYEQYRSLSAAAVISLILGIISIVAVLDFWALKIVPALGALLALTAIVQIRRRPDELSGLKPAKYGLILSLVFLIGGSSLAAITHALEVPDGYEPITYGMLKHPDDAKQNSPSPEAVALDGKRVFIKGYMFPTPHETGVTKFLLCRDNGDCCFGGQPPAADMIIVDLVPGLDTSYNRKLRHVAGTFHVAGSHSSDVKKDVLYRLDADYIK